MNSFLQLYKEDLDKFVELYQDDVRQGVEDRVRTVHFISDVVELFFPKLADTATALLGGEVIHPEDDYLSVNFGQNDAPDNLPPAPGSENENDIIR